MDESYSDEYDIDILSDGPEDELNFEELRRMKDDMEGCDDELYFATEYNMDMWLHEGGESDIYPHIFFVQRPTGGSISSPQEDKKLSFLHLPIEIRDKVYEFYFLNQNAEQNPPILDTQDDWMTPHDSAYVQICLPRPQHKILPTIELTSDNNDLKYLLTSELLQASQQLRYEGHSVLFSMHAFTTAIVNTIPRFSSFLGGVGCTLVRHLHITDTFADYHDGWYKSPGLFEALRAFPVLQTLTVTTFGEDLFLWIPPDDKKFKRTISWTDIYDGTERTLTVCEVEGILSRVAFKALSTLRCQTFTIHVLLPEESHTPELSMLVNILNKRLRKIIQSSTTSEPPSLSNTIIADVEMIESVSLDPMSSSDGVSKPDLENNLIPLYNFVRDCIYFHVFSGEARTDAIYAQNLAPDMKASLKEFIHLPHAVKSTGPRIASCGLCYISRQHCGYHNIPDQPTSLLIDPYATEVENELAVFFCDMQLSDLKYKQLRECCQSIAEFLDCPNLTADIYHQISSVFAIMKHFHSFDAPVNPFLDALDKVVDLGWSGKVINTDEVPPWDVLYRELKVRGFPKC